MNKSSSRTSGSTIRCSIGAVGDAAKELAMRHAKEHYDIMGGSGGAATRRMNCP